MVEPWEIKEGLVLHLDPDALEDKGATCTCSKKFRVQGGHFFLCLKSDVERGTWLPLYSHDGFGRTRLEEGGRTGHKKWTEGVFFWHRSQIWSASHEAIASAAAAGGDKSTAKARKLLASTHMPRLRSS